MTNIDYMRLAKPPAWCIQFPTCSACDVDLDHDGDGWTCPSCGTEWDSHASDGDTGTLPDGLTGRIVPNDEAWRFGRAYETMTPAERERRIADHLGTNAHCRSVVRDERMPGFPGRLARCAFFGDLDGHTEHDDGSGYEWTTAGDDAAADAAPTHKPCCSAHGVDMTCASYRRTHFVEVRPCCAVDAAALRGEDAPDA